MGLPKFPSSITIDPMPGKFLDVFILDERPRRSDEKAGRTLVRYDCETRIFNYEGKVLPLTVQKKRERLHGFLTQYVRQVIDNCEETTRDLVHGSSSSQEWILDRCHERCERIRRIPENVIVPTCLCLPDWEAYLIRTMKYCGKLGRLKAEVLEEKQWLGFEENMAEILELLMEEGLEKERLVWERIICAHVMELEVTDPHWLAEYAKRIGCIDGKKMGRSLMEKGEYDKFWVYIAESE